MTSGAAPRHRLSVDIGGTFTDLALYHAGNGRLYVAKTPSTPHDPSEGALAGIELITQEAGLDLADIAEITHATTHGANIVIEQKGARSALLTTDGFGDILAIQRQLRYSPYDLGLERHVSLVPRELVFEVPERLLYDGRVYVPLDERRVKEIAGRLRAEHVESAAICFLHSYANDDHERRAAAIVRAVAPEIALSLSCEVAPVMREYERASTTVADAYIRPAFERYLSNLRDALGARGFAGSLFIMQANGGIAGVELTMEAPIRAVESGPAGAVAMGTTLATGLDLPKALVFDMGGTTAKAGLIANGRAATVDTFEIDRKLLRTGTGLPLRIPSVDIIEIGAGGGSVARVSLGVIEVGPESSGAVPGPACYRRGGRRPTVTDANLLLGYLNPRFFNGGAIELGVDEAVDAITRGVADPLGISLRDAAWGIHDAVTANMEHAIRTVSTDRGHDPRQLTLIASGGAAPLHALRIARDLAMTSVLVPAFAGVMSALGLLQSDPRFDLVLSYVTDLSVDSSAELDVRFERLEAQGRRRLAAVGLDETGAAFERRIDAQYQGQGHSVEIPVAGSCRSAEAIAAVTERFRRRYAELYGSEEPDATIEVTALRLVAIAPRGHVALPLATTTASKGPLEMRPAYFPEAGDSVATAVYRRSDLAVGDTFTGPALVEDPESTVVVPPGDRVVVSANRHLLVEVNPQSGEQRRNG